VEAARGIHGGHTRRSAIYTYSMLRKTRATPGMVLSECSLLFESLKPTLSVADVKRASRRDQP
jgi:hypothetical protein